METLSYDFTVTVTPCTINSFTMSSIGDIEMTLGDSHVFSQRYTIVQDKECGYEETFVVTGQPSFVIHQKSEDRFRVEPMEDSHIGLYTITAVCTIQVPNDAQKSSYTEWRQEFTFTVTVKPCIPT